MPMNQRTYLGYGKGRAPLLFEDVKTDTAIAVNVRVENLCPEGNLSSAQICRDHACKQAPSTIITQFDHERLMKRGSLVQITSSPHHLTFSAHIIVIH